MLTVTGIGPIEVSIGVPRDGRAQPLADAAQPVVRPRTRQHGAELLAAPARRAVEGAQRAADALAHPAQHGVPDRVAVLVVDRLEVVDVEHQRADVVRAARPLDLRPHDLGAVRPVEEAGQRVDARAAVDLPQRFLQRLLGRLARGDVQQHAVAEPPAGLVGARRHPGLDPAPGAIALPQPELHPRARAVEQPLAEGQQPRAVVRVDRRLPGRRRVLPLLEPAEQVREVARAVDRAVRAVGQVLVRVEDEPGLVGHEVGGAGGGRVHLVPPLQLRDVQQQALDASVDRRADPELDPDRRAVATGERQPRRLPRRAQRGPDLRNGSRRGLERPAEREAGGVEDRAPALRRLRLHHAARDAGHDDPRRVRVHLGTRNRRPRPAAQPPVGSDVS